MESLNCLPPTAEPRATDNIDVSPSILQLADAAQSHRAFVSDTKNV